MSQCACGAQRHDRWRYGETDRPAPAARTRALRQSLLGCSLIAGLALWLTAASPVRADQTVTTTYRYNSDGALAAVTTSVAGAPAATTYNTYDNFTPDDDDPTTGAVALGNGNLVAIGPSPGTAAATTQLTYDQRNRLIGCAVSGQPAVAYAYHPNSLLASSALAGDALQFYYDSAAAVANMHQSSTALTSSFLGSVRYLSDGSEQALLQPRKDTAAVYEPTAETLLPYGYEPYGAARTEPGTPAQPPLDAATWDLSSNPFQYAGEYRDAVCGTYYLRARWYLPAQQTFLSRDPADGVHHYSYAGGNPIGRTDPSGLSYRSFQTDVGRFVKTLGVGATVLSLLPVTGEAMFLLQASAAGAFWHHTRATVNIGLGALALGVEGLRDLSGPLLNLDRLGYKMAFGLRTGADLSMAGGQSALAGFRGKHWRFDPAALGETIGATLGTVLLGRGGAGLGYRPFSLDASDVNTMWDHFRQSADAREQMLVFRRQESLYGRARWTTPWMERAHVGIYHESVVGFTPMRLNKTLFDMHVADLAFIPDMTPTVLAPRYESTFGSQLDEDRPMHFQYVGVFSKESAAAALASNPLDFTTATAQRAHVERADEFLPTGYNQLRANCQHHAAAILAEMGH